MPVPERVLAVLAVTVAVGGVIGFSIGTDPARYRVEGFARWPHDASPAPDPATAQPARSYAELLARPWRSGAAAGWSVDGEALRQGLLGEQAPREREALELRRQAIEDRARLRAFSGAPPVIPHPFSESSPPACLACHERGAALGTLVARRIPHPAYASCSQCHVAAVSLLAPESPAHAAAYASRFDPLEAPLTGSRAWPGAPPVIPHSTQMRSECLSCHGPGGRAGLRSSHPERASCLQCHALDAEREHRAARP